MSRNVRLVKYLLHCQIAAGTTLPAIADQLNISYHTLRKQFPRSEGIPMSAYIQHHRLEMAKRLLQNRQLAIFQITEKLGFSANSNFTRWFKQSTGCTPSSYRKKTSRA